MRGHPPSAGWSSYRLRWHEGSPQSHGVSSKSGSTKGDSPRCGSTREGRFVWSWGRGILLHRQNPSIDFLNLVHDIAAP